MAMAFQRLDKHHKGYIEISDLEEGSQIEVLTLATTRARIGVKCLYWTVFNLNRIIWQAETYPEELTPMEGDQTPRIFTRAPLDFDIETPRNRPPVNGLGAGSFNPVAAPTPRGAVLVSEAFEVRTPRAQ